MPSSIMAKINLELSLNKMNVATYNQIQENNRNNPEDDDPSDENNQNT